MSEVIDIHTRKPIEKIEIDENTSVAGFLTMLKKRCKEQNVESIFVLTVNKESHCDWGFVHKNEYHALLSYATLRDLEREMLDIIFPQYEIDIDD